MSWTTVRRAVLLMHRWAGLTMAGFLVIVGLTGSLLAFNTELERVFAPNLFATIRPERTRLDLAKLATSASAALPEARVLGVTYTEPDQVSVAFEPRRDPRTGASESLAFDELFLDPWSGRELGRRKNGDISAGLVNLIPFIYRIHWTLAAGTVGQWILGLTALLWTVDSFLAVLLTLPMSIVRFWRRWLPAWTVKRSGNTYRLTFDLHRAGGLWMLPILLVFAWSSVMMNIRPVYEEVMGAVFDYHSPRASPWMQQRFPPDRMPLLDWAVAARRGADLIAEQEIRRGFSAGPPLALSYSPESNSYAFEVRGSRDLFERSPKGGATTVVFDGDDGALLEITEPTGERLGDTVESWLYALHMARIFGMPYRILVVFTGLFVAFLSASGIFLWLRKRRARRKTDLRASAARTDRRASGAR